MYSLRSKIRYFREKMETSLGRARFSRRDTERIIAEASSLLREDTYLSAEFLNAASTVEKIAAKYGKPLSYAKSMLAANPVLLFEVNDTHLPRQQPPAKPVRPKVQIDHGKKLVVVDPKPVTQKTIYPTYGEIVQFAEAVKKEKKRWPKQTDGYLCIPEGFPSWMTIYARLAKEGTSVARLVQRVHPEVRVSKDGKFISKPTKPTKKPINLSGHVIAQCVKKFHETYGRLPSRKDKRECLPEGTLTWSTVYMKLWKKGISLEALLKKHLPKKEYEAIIPPRLLPWPSNEKIAEAALMYFDKYKVLPTSISKREFLPKDSQVGWSTICIKFKERHGMPFKEMVEQYLKDKSLPPLSERLKHQDNILNLNEFRDVASQNQLQKEKGGKQSPAPSEKFPEQSFG